MLVGSSRLAPIVIGLAIAPTQQCRRFHPRRTLKDILKARYTTVIGERQVVDVQSHVPGFRACSISANRSTNHQFGQVLWDVAVVGL